MRTASRKNNFIQKNYFSSMYIFLHDFFNNNKIDYIIVNCIASSFTFMLSEICKSKNVQFIVPFPARMKNYYIINHLNITKKLFVQNIIKKIDSHLIDINHYIEQAENIYNEYQTSYQQPEYSYHQKNKSSRKTFIYLFFQLFFRIIKKLCKLKLGYISFSNSLLDMKIYLNAKFQKKYFENVDINKINYIFFPLPDNPEATTLVDAPNFTNQYHLIETLSKSIPSNYTLIVKEHLPQLGKRENRFYKMVKRLPNIKLINPYINSKDIIKNSSLVITINGTVGMEAIFFSKPVLLLAESEYMNINEGYIFENNISNLSNAINLAFNLKPASKKSIIKYIISILYISFTMDRGYLWGDYHKFDHNKKEIGLNNFYNSLKKVI